MLVFSVCAFSCGMFSVSLRYQIFTALLWIRMLSGRVFVAVNLFCFHCVGVIGSWRSIRLCSAVVVVSQFVCC